MFNYMQWHGSTNKSPIILNAVKNKLTLICLRMEKTFKTKTLPSDFQVTTTKNPLLSITSSYKYKESYQTLWPIPKYQPTVEPLTQYPIGLVL